jgi:transposase
VKLANDFGCSRKTIYDTVKRYLEGEKLENRDKTGRPPILSSRAITCLYYKRAGNYFRPINSLVLRHLVIRLGLLYSEF